MACVFDYTHPCNNVKNDQPKPSSLSLIGTFGSADENVSSSSIVVAVSSSTAMGLTVVIVTETNGA